MFFTTVDRNDAAAPSIDPGMVANMVQGMVLDTDADMASVVYPPPL